MGASEKYLAGGLGLILLLEAVQHFQHLRGEDWRGMLASRPWAVRWAAYAALVLAIINFGAPKAEPFIYFQF